MDRQYYLDLAARGVSFPIGTDLVLREHADHAQIVNDGRRLGQVIDEAARRYRTPLAFPLMDLMIEKADLLHLAGVHGVDPDTFHFDTPPDEKLMAKLESNLSSPPGVRLQANIDAIRYIAQETDLIPVGMCIGPFSLMTKLLADPITAVYIAGTGMKPEEDPEVRAVERTLQMALMVVLRSVRLQVDAGAHAVCIAEPAANKAYFSPNQLEAGSDIFERYAIAPNRRIRDLLRMRGADLIFHCCGELTDMMVQRFASLDPAILSLGSSRVLWEDARILPKNVVLYGNLPSKKFYSDEVITLEQVEQKAQELRQKMRQAGHPFILGSECDVLHVPGCEQTIRRKVEVISRGG